MGPNHPDTTSETRSLKILYVDTETVWRGGQEQLLSLMTGMLARGHKVWLASPLTALLSRKAHSAGVKVVQFNQRSEFSPLAFFRLLSILRHNRFDLIHFNTPRAILAGGISARLINRPAIVASRRVNFALRSRLSAWKYNLLVDRVLTVSSSIRETLIEGGLREEKVRVVYEGVELEWIDSLEAGSIELETDGVVIGTVAHLSHEKGHGSLLLAVSRLKAEFPDARFFIAGDGEKKDELEQLANRYGISDRVIFAGFRTDCEALMKRFDIFCLPSLSEGLSSAIMAAMANRLPVVSTRVGGIPELVTHNETGYLVSPDSPEELAEALARLIRSGELRRKMGEAGRRRVESRFTVALKQSKTAAAYSELLREKQIL